MKCSKSRVLLLALLLTITVFIVGCSGNKAQTTNVGIATQPDPQRTRVIMLDIGQGDSMLIQTNGKNILVDASKIDTRKALLAKLEKYNVKSLDLVIATHAHEDHIGGMDAVFDKFYVKEVYDPGVPSTSKLFLNYLKKIKDKKIKFTVPKAGSKVELGPNTYLEFYTPFDEKYNNIKAGANNTSLVFKLVDSKFTMLFTGDIEKDIENILVRKYGDSLSSNILKSPHHGSSTSSTQKFLDKVKSKVVLISCAAGNDYNHPHDAVVKRYENSKMDIYVTNNTGDIGITATDKGYQINTSK